MQRDNRNPRGSVQVPRQKKSSRRRYDDDGQSRATMRAFVAAALRLGVRVKPQSQAAAAKMCGANVSYVVAATAVLQARDPDLIADALYGRVPTRGGKVRAAQGRVGAGVRPRLRERSPRARPRLRPRPGVRRSRRPLSTARPTTAPRANARRRPHLEESKMAEHENSVGESDDWFTPKKYFDAIGLTYDLDPAHPGLGTLHCFVTVKEVYTINDDGLNRPWHGLVFCNPPYGTRRGHVPWLQKLIAHNSGVGSFALTPRPTGFTMCCCWRERCSCFRAARSNSSAHRARSAVRQGTATFSLRSATSLARRSSLSIPGSACAGTGEKIYRTPSDTTNLNQPKKGLIR